MKGRIARGRWVDPAQSVPFRFDGRQLDGIAGDTLASALLASGVRIVARSSKYHRPRGLMAAGVDEPNAYVRLDVGAQTEPNTLATLVELASGMSARSLNAWPNAAHDAGAAADWLAPFVPAGFYYKTFMWPSWRAYEPLIRRATGLGKLPDSEHTARDLAQFAHCDVLVVGAGPAGLAATRACAAAGVRVMLLELKPRCGGMLHWDTRAEDEARARAWIDAQLAALRDCPDATLVTRTVALGYYDHNLVAALESFAPEREPRGEIPRHRLWQIRARQVILATGAFERPLVFPHNDLPGVMLASAAREYLNGYGVAAGERAIVFTNNDSGYLTALDLARAGAKVACVVDPRPEAGAPLADAVRAAGVRIFTDAFIEAARGSRQVEAVDLRRRNNAGGPWREACDAVLVSGGWDPAVHLFAQSGGTLKYDPELAAFLADRHPLGCIVAGSATGTSTLHAAIADGQRAGAEALHRLGRSARAGAVDGLSLTEYPPSAIMPWWTAPDCKQKHRAWVDFHSDVTQADIELAARENYRSVEHLKRYTTLGMSPDQGKTSNVNGLAIAAESLDRPVSEVGTTRFRPPFIPASLAALAEAAQGPLYAPRRLLPATAAHRELGAHTWDYSGWQRPQYYTSNGKDRAEAVKTEYLAVRHRVGLFDSSPLGKIEVAGRDAAELLHRVYINNVRSLKVGSVRYGLMLNEAGIIIDDGVFARLDHEQFLCSPSSAATPRIGAWLEEWRQCEWPDLRVAVIDVTTAWASLTLAGPAARGVLERIGTDIDLASDTFAHMTIREGTVAGVPARVQRVSFSGELQFEVAVAAGYGADLMRAMLDAGRPDGIVPIGIDAWLQLRIDKGFIHVGADTDGMTIPDDVGMAGLYARKPEDFIGRRSLQRPAMVAPGREQLVGLEALDGGDPLPIGACVVAQDFRAPPAEILGRVTSSAFSWALGRPVALARVRDGRKRMGETVRLFDAGRLFTAKICPPVFYDPGGARAHA